jgi:acyl carrier protein
MNQDEVLARLAQILSDVTGVDPADVTPQTTFAADLGIDSLTMIDLAVAAEDRFGLLIGDDEVSRFRTVGDAVDYIDHAAAIGPALGRFYVG